MEPAYTVGVRIDVLTTFPELFDAVPPGVLGVSMPKRAIDAGKLSVVATNIRDFADPPHFKTDDRPFGGGPGMVMLCEPVWRATMHAEALDGAPVKRIFLAPHGERLSQPLVEELAAEPRLLLLCGHYEGVDERVIEKLDPMVISVGDYVLSGGELAALTLIDAIARLQPGVLGDQASSTQDSFGEIPNVNPNGETIPPKMFDKWLAEHGLKLGDRVLDCPHYTRPRSWEGMETPEELLSGDHNLVMRWRLAKMAERTKRAAGALE